MNKTDNLIYSTSINYGLPPGVAQIIVAQARLETADYTSKNFVMSNNLFGYKYAGQAIATQGIESSEGNYYAKYKSLEDSVEELWAWLNRREKEGKLKIRLLTTAELYANALKFCSFFGEPLSLYIQGLQSKMSKIDLTSDVQKGVVSYSQLTQLVSGMLANPSLTSVKTKQELVEDALEISRLINQTFSL
jgi:mannosyl-glycoprotein endo-beta-N-acetylglucosaminidase